MLIDRPDLTNSERLQQAANALEFMEPVTILLTPNFKTARTYTNWITAILRERGYSDESAEILSCGATIIFDY